MPRKSAGPSDAQPQRSRFFWVFLLVLLEIAVWTVVMVVADSETAATIAALVVAGVFVFAFRERIWGADWRERMAAERERQQRKQQQRKGR
ncbi:MAG: hypothetical protein M0P31_15780 [Solirubrobacteraceae bacterium]|nr:hypothetical protein [Solirubrobacteraceae bacterium]